MAGERRKSRQRRFDAGEYRRLLTRSLPKVIETQEENEACIRLLEKLDERSEQLTAAEKKLAEHDPSPLRLPVSGHSRGSHRPGQWPPKNRETR